MFFPGKISSKTRQKIIKDLNTIPQIKGSKIVVSLSGGEDSLFLLAILCSLKRKYGFKLFPVHINHDLIAEDSLYAKIALSGARKLGEECLIFRARPCPEGKNLENWMRNERRRILETYRKKKKADFIAVAHHKSDLVESILLHVFRGCGLKGLKGMEIQRGKFIRPILNVEKREIEFLMRKTTLPYYNDKLNYSQNKRSRIRHELLPFIRENFDPQIEEHIVKLSRFSKKYEKMG